MAFTGDQANLVDLRCYSTWAVNIGFHFLCARDTGRGGNIDSPQREA